MNTNKRYSMQAKSKQETAPKIIAIAVADIHLSHKPPIARSNEINWFDAMGRYLDQLRQLQLRRGNPPIICAGDIFDRWNAPAELINFAIKNLPIMYSIPGNHDLPLHSYEDIKKSAYWTLVECGNVIDMPVTEWQSITHDGITMSVSPFPTGYDVEPLGDPSPITINVAVVHSYICTKETAFHGAGTEQRIEMQRKNLKGYDIAIWGDNHIPFEYVRKGKEDQDTCLVFNCGGFLRRKTTEREHRPSVGLVYSDCSIVRHYLDTELDTFIDAKDAKALESIDFDAFLTELNNLADASIDFRSAIQRAIEVKGLSRNVSEIIYKAIEGKE